MVFSQLSQMTPKWTVGEVLTARPSRGSGVIGGMKGMVGVRLSSRRGVASPETDQGTEVDVSSAEDA